MPPNGDFLWRIIVISILNSDICSARNARIDLNSQYFKQRNKRNNNRN